MGFNGIRLLIPEVAELAMCFLGDCLFLEADLVTPLDLGIVDVSSYVGLKNVLNKIDF